VEDVINTSGWWKQPLEREYRFVVSWKEKKNFATLSANCFDSLLNSICQRLQTPMSLISKYGKINLRFGMIDWDYSTQFIPVEVDCEWEGSIGLGFCLLNFSSDSPLSDSHWISLTEEDYVMLRPNISTLKPSNKKSLIKLLEFLRTDTQTTKLDYSSMWLYFVHLLYIFAHLTCYQTSHLRISRWKI